MGETKTPVSEDEVPQTPLAAPQQPEEPSDVAVLPSRRSPAYVPLPRRRPVQEEPASPIRTACRNPYALGISRTIKIDPAAKPLHVGLKTYRQTLELEDHEVILTFDDGPNPATTARVLDALREECVKATFFLIGNNAAANPTLVRREFAEGHTIGTHSWSHPERTLRGMSYDAAIQEITHGISAVHEAAHDAPSVPAPFFRFPGFADTKESVRWLDEHHIAVFGCDLWASDWKNMSPETELKLIMERLEESGRGIILLHDARAQTATMLPKFLQALKERGYRVVHMVPVDSGESPSLEPAPPGWHSETEEIIRRVMPQLAPRAAR